MFIPALSGLLRPGDFLALVLEYFRLSILRSMLWRLIGLRGFSVLFGIYGGTTFVFSTPELLFSFRLDLVPINALTLKEAVWGNE